jgi:phosphotriesterase-related protein
VIDLAKNIQTAKGPISLEMLGKTLTHEHMLWDQRCWWQGEPEDPVLKELAYGKLEMAILGQVYYHPHLNIDNIVQLDPLMAAEEALLFKNSGGNTIVDVTSIGLKRDPLSLLKISEMTGLNIILGSGYYISNSYPEDIKGLNKYEIAEKIKHEFLNGIDLTSIKPGVIGEIGITSLNNENEIRMLQAASIAQRYLGVPLYIHPPLFEVVAHKIIEVIKAEGADITKVVICHCDTTLDNAEYHDYIAKMGANLEYDQFGLEFMSLEGFFLPRDIDRIYAIKKQTDMGNLSKILISQDISFKTCLTRFGGWGYAHILRDIVPLMKKENITDTMLDMILIDNPRRLFT